MIDRPLEQADPDEDWIDGALREEGRRHRAAYLDDGGFTSRLMAALPAPDRQPAWRRPAVAGLWATAGIAIALALPGALLDVAHEIVRVLIGQPLSLTGIATGMVALGAVTWAAAAFALRDD